MSDSVTTDSTCKVEVRSTRRSLNMKCVHPLWGVLRDPVSSPSCGNEGSGTSTGAQSGPECRARKDGTSGVFSSGGFRVHGSFTDEPHPIGTGRDGAVRRPWLSESPCGLVAFRPAPMCIWGSRVGVQARGHPSCHRGDASPLPHQAAKP